MHKMHSGSGKLYIGTIRYYLNRSSIGLKRVHNLRLPCRFVVGWIRLYYCNDEDVQHDDELQNWIREIFTEGFLGLSHIGSH